MATTTTRLIIATSATARPRQPMLSTRSAPPVPPRRTTAATPSPSATSSISIQALRIQPACGSMVATPTGVSSATASTKPSAARPWQLLSAPSSSTPPLATTSPLLATSSAAALQARAARLGRRLEPRRHIGSLGSNSGSAPRRRAVCRSTPSRTSFGRVPTAAAHCPESGVGLMCRRVRPISVRLRKTSLAAAPERVRFRSPPRAGAAHPSASVLQAAGR